MKKLIVFAVLIWAGLVSADEVLLSDTFSTNETRTAGTQLNGLEIEVGGVNWTSSVNATFVSSTEDVWSSNESNYMYARVPLPDLTGVDILEWKIDARVRDTQADGGVPKGFLALGRSDFNANIQEGIRLTINEAGSWVVGYHDGSSFATITNGTVSGDGEFAGFFYNTLKVQYDFNNDTLSAWVNSNHVLDAYDMTGKPITFGAAGWVTQNNVSQDVRYDNFFVSSISASAPTNPTTVFLDISPFSSNMIELVFRAENPSLCYPEVTDSLVITNWSSVAHSTNGLPPFVVTNLTYSSAFDTNSVIYVERTADTQFYRIGTGQAEEPEQPVPQPDLKITFKNTEQGILKIHQFMPEGYSPNDTRPAIVLFFGGGWANGSPNQFYRQCGHFASLGMVAYSAEYRIKNKHETTPHESLRDAVSAIRWLRKHADEQGIDPNRIAAGGGSAGGHLALASALCDGYDEQSEDLSVSARPDALVLFNPVLDLGPGTWGNQYVAPEWEAISPMHNIHSNAPPTLIMLGTEDAIISVESAQTFTGLMTEAGADCRLILYEGQPHGFFNEAGYDETLQDSVDFLDELGYLPNP